MDKQTVQSFMMEYYLATKSKKKSIDLCYNMKDLENIVLSARSPIIKTIYCVI